MSQNTIEVVLTGTGTPIPEPGRAGPGTLVRVAGATLQFDVGRSTVLRLAEAGTRADELDAIFITHHHSDHVTDLADLLMSAWLLGRDQSLDVVVPDGLTTEYAEHALDPLHGDMVFRRGHRGVAGGIATPKILSFSPSAVPETVWQNESVQVQAIRVRHEPVEGAVGYRVESKFGRVAISGDTRVCEEMEVLATGARILVHEVVLPDRIPANRSHTVLYHSPATELGAMAQRAGVETLVLTHLWPSPVTNEDARAFADGVREGGFTGDVVVGSDLTSVVFDERGLRVSIPEGRGVTGLFLPNTRSAVQH